jgi:hypothetical protein
MCRCSSIGVELLYIWQSQMWDSYCAFFCFLCCALQIIFFCLMASSCLSLDLRLLITSLVFCCHFLVSPLIYASDYLFGILWPLSCLSLDLRLLITSLVSCGHCLVSPLIYGFWLPLWYLQTFLANMLFVKCFIC